MRRRAMSMFGLVVLAVGWGPALASSAWAASGWTAFVAHDLSTGSVTPLSTATNAAGAPIPVGPNADGVAITPDGATVYVANDNGTVTPISTATDTAGAPISVGNQTHGVAVAPDGKTVYAANLGNDTVTPISTATNTAGAPISVGSSPDGVAITPDGRTVYVANSGGTTVTPISTATNTAGAPIPAGPNPIAVAITPDGSTVYVADYGGTTVTPISTATNKEGAPITVGSTPEGIAVTPDGRTVYVANFGSDSVTPISTATNTAGPPIPVGTNPTGVAITPDGKTAYVANTNASPGSLTPISTATNTPAAPIQVGDRPAALAITPDQAPSAAVSVVAGLAGQPSSFDGSASSSPVGSVASYRWDFGDGSTATTTTPHTTHVYAHAGSYMARLTVTNSAGTSTEQVFTGQTVSRQGGPRATSTSAVTVVVAALSALRVSPRTLRLAGRVVDGRCVKPSKKNNAHKHCRRAIKLKISYALNGADMVTFTLKRRAPGRKLKGRCAKPTNKLQKHNNCRRLIDVPGKVVTLGAAGANSFVWGGEIGRHKVGPGTYRLTATPTGGKPQTITFKIVG